jgi:DNA-directed RNA polymerase omega subunit
MYELPPNIESKFRLVHIAARRAEQLMQGARRRVETTHTKAARVALDEVHADLVRWQIAGTEPTEADAEAAAAADLLPTAAD